MNSIPIDEILNLYYVEKKSFKEIADLYKERDKVDLTALDIAQIIRIYFKVTGKPIPK